MIGGRGAPALEGGFRRRRARGVDEDTPALATLSTLCAESTERVASLATRGVGCRRDAAVALRGGREFTDVIS